MFYSKPIPQFFVIDGFSIIGFLQIVVKYWSIVNCTFVYYVMTIKYFIIVSYNMYHDILEMKGLNITRLMSKFDILSLQVFGDANPQIKYTNMTRWLEKQSANL